MNENRNPFEDQRERMKRLMKVRDSKSISTETSQIMQNEVGNTNWSRGLVFLIFIVVTVVIFFLIVSFMPETQEKPVAPVTVTNVAAVQTSPTNFPAYSIEGAVKNDQSTKASVEYRFEPSIQ